MADAIPEELKERINAIAETTNLAPEFVYDVWRLLEAYGYGVQPSDDWLIGFCIQKVDNSIRNKCNAPELPEGLMKLAAQMAAGEFFLAKKSMGQLDGFSLDFEPAAASIQEGDTSVKFAIDAGSLTPEQRLDAFIAYLIKGDEAEFAKYRRLQW